MEPFYLYTNVFGVIINIALVAILMFRACDTLFKSLLLIPFSLASLTYSIYVLAEQVFFSVAPGFGQILSKGGALEILILNAIALLLLFVV